MSFHRLLLASATALLLCSACASNSGTEESDRRHYFRIRNTDYRGNFVAEWIAEGHVSKTEFGYSFKAVEHDTAPPGPQFIHYPEGRRVEISGPNLVVRPCGQPLWLYKIRHGMN